MIDSADDVLLSLRGMSKAFFGAQALTDVSLDVSRGHVLGLVGENGAGKSTLVNIVGGVVAPDAGSMLFDGTSYRPDGPADASRLGIAFIHQELNLFTNLSIAENMFIDDFPRRRVGPIARLDRGAMRARTRELLEQVGLDLAPDTSVDRLSPGERQLVEVAKALHLDARLIILDEPTTSLTARETERLFALIGRLRVAGTTMIYISHILADVLRLADEVAILRDGELVAHGPRDEIDIDRMITLMVGRPLERLYPPRTSEPRATPLLEIAGLSAAGIVKGIDLELFEGEVLGLFGLMGSGRTELARIIFGLDPFDVGTISVGGRRLSRSSPRRSVRDHVAFITEDRRAEGLLMSASVADNIALVSLGEFAVSPLGLLDQDRLVGGAADMVGLLRIKAGAIAQQAALSLSGGNQQKVVLARWLLSRPRLFILDEPTRGIDVGAKHDIYSIIDQLAVEGGGVLFISSELEELIAMCDRILVMSRGELVGAFQRGAFEQEAILRSAFRAEVPV